MKNATNMIGITGNIATGKSVVRQMLANSGALGLDADLIAHRLYDPGGPAYQAVIDAFGEQILTADRRISRKKLGGIVFSDPEKLQKLESLLHPAVTKTILRRAAQSRLPIAAVEAIKLIEAGLGALCTAIWVSHASQNTQVERLLQTRGLTGAEAQSRVEMQPPQSAKLAQADVVIDTEGPFISTWMQVQDALNDTIYASYAPDPLHLKSDQGWAFFTPNRVPQKALESFWGEASGEPVPALYERLGQQMLLPIMKAGRLAALILWETWQFTAALKRILPAGLSARETAPVMALFQAQALSQQCELLLVPGKLARRHSLEPAGVGFRQGHPHSLAHPAWRGAADRLLPHDHEPWIKVLAQPFEIDLTLSDHTSHTV